MLKLRYLFENNDLAKTLLENWEYDLETLDEMFSYYRISSNAIYPFYRKGKRRFLRFAPTDEKERNNIYGELEFIQYLRANGYPAMEPIPSKSGEFILEVSTKWGNYFVSVFESVNGTRLDRTDLSDEIMFIYGKALGKMHHLSVDYAPITEKWTHENVMNWIEKELKNHENTERAISELDKIRKELSLISVTKQNYGLVHYDFELDNVFFNNELKQCEAIDFDDGMYHWYVIDIEQCLDEVAGEIDASRFENAKIKFIEGYKSEFPLSVEMVNLLPLMRRFINLYSYTRILRSLSERFENEPEWLVELRKKLEFKMDELKKSMG